MKPQKVALFITTLSLIGATAVLLTGFQARQKLGAPGVKAHPIGDGKLLEVDLPQLVLDYRSERQEMDAVTKDSLPADTSFGRRLYRAPDGFATALTVVLMGSDRTSLHKPQFCLTGAGFNIDPLASTETTVRVRQPCTYELPVVKLVATKQVTSEGQVQTLRALYVYWFVADDQLSASVTGFERMWSMATKLLRSGVLQRWAYVSCLAYCAPGQEEATFERLKEFIDAAAPQFQLTPRPAPAAITAR
jgi:Protein of unknown function (DUF3485)